MECSICLTDISDNGQRLTCGHSFHLSCIVQWVSQPGRRTCPLCRQTINHFLLIPTTPALTHEDSVRVRFRREVRISFIMDTNFPMNLDAAIWVMEVYQLNQWMPPDWISYYEGRPQTSQTYESYRLLQNGRAQGNLMSIGGRPPRRLYFCRTCRYIVYSAFRYVQQHLFNFHNLP